MSRAATAAAAVATFAAGFAVAALLLGRAAERADDDGGDAAMKTKPAPAATVPASAEATEIAGEASEAPTAPAVSQPPPSPPPPLPPPPPPVAPPTTESLGPVPAWMSNELVKLTHRDETGSAVELTLLVERRGPQPTIALALPSEPFNRLRLDAKRGTLKVTARPRHTARLPHANNATPRHGSPGPTPPFATITHPIPPHPTPTPPPPRQWDGGVGRDATWLVEDLSKELGPNCIGLRSVASGGSGKNATSWSDGEKGGGKGKDKASEKVWLTAGRDSLHVRQRQRKDDDLSDVMWTAEAIGEGARVAPAPAAAPTAVPATLPTAPDVPPLSTIGRVAPLSEAELRAFVRDGYLVVRGGAAAADVAQAKAFINGRLSLPKREFQPFGEYAAAPIITPEVGGDAANAPEVVGVAKSASVARLISQVVGPGKVAPIGGCQIALRFPHVVDSLVAGGAAVSLKVGGRDWHTDGLRQGKKHSFSLLVGVALSDSPGADSGNLCVWPGSHRTTVDLMRHPDGKVRRDNGGYEEEDGPLPDLGTPVQLHLRAGDLVIAHHTLAHCGGPHVGADIRYMLYYRVRHVDWPRLVSEQCLDKGGLWHDLEGGRGLTEGT